MALGRFSSQAINYGLGLNLRKSGIEPRSPRITLPWAGVRHMKGDINDMPFTTLLSAQIAEW